MPAQERPLRLYRAKERNRTLQTLVSEGGADLRQKLGIGNVAAGDSAQVRAAVPANLEAARGYAEGLVN